MKKLLPTVWCLIVLFLLPPNAWGADQAPVWSDLQSGDILLQTTTSAQDVALKLATGSEFTHCGVVFWKDGQAYVYEAIGPVISTPIAQWIDRGVDRRFVALRLKDPHRLTPAALEKLQRVGESFAGRPYDPLFQWSDDRIYCSELVWKMFHRALGLDLTPLHTFADYDLDHGAVQALIKERYGTTLPMNEPVVAPSDLLDSPHLRVVHP